MNKEELKENINKSSKVVGSLLVCYNNKEDEWKNDIIEIKKVNLFALIDQLDEPETLSLDWIDENVVEGDFRGEQQFWYGGFIEEEKVRNLLVPKQPFVNSEELPKIPQFVWEYIQEGHELGVDLGTALTIKTNHLNDIKKYIRDNEETFARAWLAYPNIEVEKEQKYRIRFGLNSYAQRFSDKRIDDSLIYKAFAAKFTKEEILALDNGEIYFEHFAVPVEEEEE